MSGVYIQSPAREKVAAELQYLVRGVAHSLLVRLANNRNEFSRAETAAVLELVARSAKLDADLMAFIDQFMAPEMGEP